MVPQNPERVVEFDPVALIAGKPILLRQCVASLISRRQCGSDLRNCRGRRRPTTRTMWTTPRRYPLAHATLGVRNTFPFRGLTMALKDVKGLSLQATDQERMLFEINWLSERCRNL